MKQKIIGLIAAFIIKTYYQLFIFFKVTFEHEEDRAKFFAAYEHKHPKEKALVLAFFHQDELVLIPYFINKNLCALVSSSKDGEIMHTALNELGLTTVRGSSSKKSVAGLLAAIKKVKQGYNFAIAVDGPKGPIYEVKEGVIKISEKSGYPIVPIRGHVGRHYLFKKAWNQARIPMPFSTVTLHVGKIDFYNKESLQEKLRGL